MPKTKKLTDDQVRAVLQVAVLDLFRTLTLVEWEGFRQAIRDGETSSGYYAVQDHLRAVLGRDPSAVELRDLDEMLASHVLRIADDETDEEQD